MNPGLRGRRREGGEEHERTEDESHGMERKGTQLK